jgi:hypothetical protein
MPSTSNKSMSHRRLTEYMKKTDESTASKSGGKPETPVQKLARLSLKGRFERAIQLGTNLHNADPGNPQISAWLGYSLLQTGQKNEGRALLEPTLGLKIGSNVPSNAYLRNVLTEHPERARQVFLNLVEKNPAFARTHVSIDSPSPLGKAYSETFSKLNPSGIIKPVVFYHLPFTGGTSIQVALRLAYEKDASFNIKRRSGLIGIARYSALPRKERASLSYIHLHHPYPLAPPADNVFFTVLRDPVSYFLSGYYKRRNLGSKIMPTRDVLIKDAGLPEAVEFAQEHGLHNGLTKQLAILHPSLKKKYSKHHRARKSLTDAVFKRTLKDRNMCYITYEEDLFYPKATEGIPETDLLDLATEVLKKRFGAPGVIKHLEASFLVAMARTGLQVSPRILHFGASHRPARESISPEVKQRLVELNHIDQLLYDRAVTDFEKSHPDLIAAIALNP